MPANVWDVALKLAENIKYVLGFLLILLIGYGLLNLDAVVTFLREAMGAFKALS